MTGVVADQLEEEGEALRSAHEAVSGASSSTRETPSTTRGGGRRRATSGGSRSAPAGRDRDGARRDHGPEDLGALA